MIMPEILKQRIIDYLKQGKRFDGRELEEYRDIEIKLGISNNAEGSCSVKFGETEVYAGVKMDAVEPYSDGPDEGTLTVSMELSPMASPDFETGPPRIEAVEMGRIVDRGIRESKIIDVKKLCIKEGEKVWGVYLDIYAINYDGNLLDVASLAGIIALANSKIPYYDEKEGKVDRDKERKDKLPMNKENIAVNMTFHKIGEHFIADPSKNEEEISEFRVSIALDADGKIHSMQKGKEGAVSFEEMEKILNLAEIKFKEIYSKVEKYLK